MTLVAVLAAVAMEAGANPFPSDEDLSKQGADRYLGLPAPGSVPIVFAPGLVSTDNAFEFSSFDTMTIEDRILCTKLSGGVWAKPTVAPFSGMHSDNDVEIAPDGTLT